MKQSNNEPSAWSCLGRQHHSLNPKLHCPLKIKNLKSEKENKIKSNKNI